MAEHVWLGLAGDLVSDPNAVDVYTTKVGGAPVYPGAAVPEAAAIQLHCSLCSSQLSLVLQAYAPHPAVAERIILVFGCSKLGCGKSAECWRALRCQLQQQQHSSSQSRKQQPSESTASESQQQPQPDQQSPIPPPPPAAAAAADNHTENSAWGVASDWSNPIAAAATAAAADPWSAAGSSDFATDESSVTTLSACNAFDFSDLTSSLEAAAHQAAAAAAAAAKLKSRSMVDHAAAAEDVAAAATAAVCCRGSAGSELPEFYLYAEAEPGEAAAKAINHKELQHVQQLLQEYEAQEAGAATTGRSAAPVASSSSTAAAAGGGGGGGVNSEDGASWAGELYEKEEIRGVDKGYLKFSKRLQRRPEQCARYCLGGEVLWPKAPPQPTPCSRCGGPRVFELQLMPALIPMVIEAGQMRQEQQLPVNHEVIDAVANWEWCTVAVFTCQASCSSRSSKVSEANGAASDSAAVTQCDSCFEEVFVINEQECHTALPVPHIGPPAAGGAGAAAQADDDAESGGGSASGDEDETFTRQSMA